MLRGIINATGWSRVRPEITPFEPDLGNTSVGKRLWTDIKKTVSSLDGFLFL